LEEKQTIIDFLYKVVHIWRNEISEPKLQKLDYNFMDMVHAVLDEIKKEKNKLDSGVEKDILESIEHVLEYLINDIKCERILKLLYNWLETRDLPRDILPEERYVLKGITKLMTNVTEIAKKMTSIIDAYKLDNVNIIDKRKRVLCVSLVDIGSFVGFDLMIYKGIKKGAIIFIPEENFVSFKKCGVKVEEIHKPK